MWRDAFYMAGESSNALITLEELMETPSKGHDALTCELITEEIEFEMMQEVMSELVPKLSL